MDQEKWQKLVIYFKYIGVERSWDKMHTPKGGISCWKDYIYIHIIICIDSTDLIHHLIYLIYYNTICTILTT